MSLLFHQVRVPLRFAAPVLLALLAACSGDTGTDALTPGVGPTGVPNYSGIGIRPQTVAVLAGDTVRLSSWGFLPNGDSLAAPVRWTAEGGTIDSDGLYHAADQEGTYPVVASSPAIGLSDTASISVLPKLAGVRIEPDSVALAPGAVQTLRLIGLRTNGTELVLPANWAATGGGISSEGTYSAGQASGRFQVVATQLVATTPPLADTAVIVIAAPTASLVGLATAPADTAISAGQSVQFGVTGVWSDSSRSIPAVTWSATGGTITPDGLFRAGTQGGGFQVVATASDGRTATAHVTISAPTVTRFTLSPGSATVAAYDSVAFSAAAAWSDGGNHPVTVSYATTGGTITASGIYHAGSATGMFLVIAACSCGRADTANVTVQARAPQPVLTQLAIAPSSVAIAAGGTQQFTVSATWSDGSHSLPLLTFGATGGAVTANGLYTAGSGAGAYRVIAASGAGGPADTATVTVTAAAPTLRQLASARGFQIGTAVRDTAFSKDAAYRQVLSTEYNSIVPEDATDFWPIHPGANQYSFAAADALVSFARANDITIHGHSLVWYSWIPTWVTGGGYTNEQIGAILKDHITTVVGRYRGQIASWDVVNEVIDNQHCCGLQSSFWLDRLGPQYIDSAFVWAHQADPRAKLFLDDYGTEVVNPKSSAVLALAQALKSRGVPIDGVGFQMHILHVFPAPTSAQIQTNFERFAAAGFDIRITEMDVDIPDDGTTAALESQAATYRAVLDACLRVSRCGEFTTWGFSDRFSWVPQQFPGYGRALPFDSNYQPKPAFDSLLARLAAP